MSSRLGWFALGAVTAIVGVGVGAYVFVKAGGVSMETSARPLPLEATVARMALRASLGNAAAQRDPLPLSDENMLAGARQYRDQCAGCHGIPGQAPPGFSKGMFPPRPSCSKRTAW